MQLTPEDNGRAIGSIIASFGDYPFPVNMWSAVGVVCGLFDEGYSLDFHGYMEREFSKDEADRACSGTALAIKEIIENMKGPR